MNYCEDLNEIESHLPNGFHDAILESITVNFSSGVARLDLQLFVGDPDAIVEEEREAYKKATLCLSDLVYVVIEAPACTDECPKTGPLRIDGGNASADSVPAAARPPKLLPSGAFAYWFFVEHWNSFIHVAARGADLQMDAS